MKFNESKFYFQVLLMIMVVASSSINSCYANQARVSVPRASSFKRVGGIMDNDGHIEIKVGGYALFQANYFNEGTKFSNNGVGLSCKSGCSIYYYVKEPLGTNVHAKMLVHGLEKYTIFDDTLGKEAENFSIPLPPSINVSKSENATFWNDIRSNLTGIGYTHLCYGLGYVDDNGKVFINGDCQEDDGDGGGGSCSITNGSLKFDFGDLKKNQASNSRITESINVECTGDPRSYTLSANKIDLTNGMDVDFYLNNNGTVSSKTFQGSQTIPIIAELSGVPKTGKFKGNGVITLNLL